jgi:hypothetical protein
MPLSSRLSHCSRPREAKVMVKSVINRPTGGLYRNGRVSGEDAHVRARAHARVIVAEYPPDLPAHFLAASSSSLKCELVASGSFQSDCPSGGAAARKRSSKTGPKIRLTGLTRLTAGVDRRRAPDRTAPKALM